MDHSLSSSLVWHIPGYECTCIPDFHGTTCSSRKDYDSIRNFCQQCLNDSICLEGDSLIDSSCLCPYQFTGKYCEILLDACHSNPCSSKGTCEIQDQQFVCKCSLRFEGKLCSKRTDFCENISCGSGKCNNLPTSFSCTCPAHQTGIFCEIFIPEMSPCFNGPCENGKCLTVYESVSQILDFSCSCDPGFTGLDCSVQIEFCNYHSIYQGDNYEDHTLLKSCLENGGSCENFINSWRCNCPDNRKGPSCEISYDPCSSSPCSRKSFSSVCVGSGDDFSCVCDHGYTGDFCKIDIDECESSPCINGICSNLPGSFKCECFSRKYTGTYCEKVIDFCTLHPCDNSDSCVNEEFKRVCVCSSGYTGQSCRVPIDPCSPNPCHAGYCVSENGSFQCYCPFAKTGNLCETEVLRCTAEPTVCNGKGDCVDLTATKIMCLCYPGYHGERCEQQDVLKTLSVAVCDCVSAPGVSCDKTTGACRCPENRHGDRCQHNVDICAYHQPCDNGVCENLFDDPVLYRCKCKRGYRGKNCDELINFCDSRIE